MWTDLLHYLRDLLIVQTGGENTHHSPVFVENLALPQENLFEMIRLATVSLADIKSSLQPKIYAEMMTIRLAEIKPEPALSGAVESEICTETGNCPSQTRTRKCGNQYLSQQIQLLVAQQRARQSIVWIAIKFNRSYKRPLKILI